MIDKRIEEEDRERSRADDEAKPEALRADRARREREELKLAARVFIENCNAEDEAERRARNAVWRCACGEANPERFQRCIACAAPKRGAAKAGTSEMSAAKLARLEKFEP